MSPLRGALRYSLAVCFAVCLAAGFALALPACKKDAPQGSSAVRSPPAGPASAAPAEARPPVADPVPPPLPPLQAGPTARFVSIAAMKKQPLFAPFAGFVDTDDDLEESSSDSASEEDDDASPDRPPSDLQVTRLAFGGELYLFSYEENCGEDLEDQRNLQQVLLERRLVPPEGDGGAPAPTLVEVYRKRLCGESPRGFSVDQRRLSASGPELLVRTWLIDPDGASEHTLRAFRATASGLSQVGLQRDAMDGAVRFDVSFPRRGHLSLVEVGATVRADDGAERREVLRYALAPSGFVRQEPKAPPGAGVAAPAPAAVPPATGQPVAPR